MNKEICPICLGSKQEMIETTKGLKYKDCKVCDENGEVNNSMFEYYEEYEE